jgi:hypothetical protein
MPINPDLACVVVLGDAYLHTDENDRQLTGLADLCEVLGIESALEALKVARGRGQLTEGSHALPGAVRDYLASIGHGSTFVRGWTFGTSTPKLSTHSVLQLSEVLRESKFEEVEACDSTQVWYLRFRDDDPLVFLAMPRERVSELVRLSPETCLEVEPGFVYAD